MPARFAIAFVAALLSLGASPPRTTLTLHGPSEHHPRLGNPLVRIAVVAEPEGVAARLSERLTADLTGLSHTRRAGEEGAADYLLAVRVEPRESSGPADLVRFAASLEIPGTGIVWRTEGRTETGGRGLDEEVLASVARNLVAALIHDEWLPKRRNPDDPPPAAPFVQRKD